MARRIKLVVAGVTVALSLVLPAAVSVGEAGASTSASSLCTTLMPAVNKNLNHFVAINSGASSRSKDLATIKELKAVATLAKKVQGSAPRSVKSKVTALAKASSALSDDYAVLMRGGKVSNAKIRTDAIHYGNDFNALVPACQG
jgi:hypothetical protein